MRNRGIVRPQEETFRVSDNTFVSLFSGAGGLDLGLERAGWNCLTQLDADEDCAETLRRTTKNSEQPIPVLETPLEQLSVENLMDVAEVGPGQLGLLAGGPPCQPFTTSGLRLAMQDRRAVSLFPAYLRLVEVLRPSMLLMENVDGLLSAALRHRPMRNRTRLDPPLMRDETKGSFLLWLLNELADLGYSVTWGVLEAADYGTAQLRQRAILAGKLGVIAPALPVACYGGVDQPAYRTLRDAIECLDVLGPVQSLSVRKQAVYEHIPPGGNWRSLSKEMQQETMGAAFFATGGKSGWWRRLAWDEPAPTILGMPDHSSTALIHPDITRCLSVRECAALQGFPNDIEFAGTVRSQYQQIGNAVPIQLGLALGKALDGGLNVEEDTPLVPSWRKISANRRIGTHGWVIPGKDGHAFHLLAKPRRDHVWTEEADGSSRIHARF